jgi:hypothetical protein
VRHWIARQVVVRRSEKSGRGLPQSKTWRRQKRHGWRASVLECASPLALFLLLPTVASTQSTDDVPPLLPALTEIPPTLWDQHGALIVMLGIALVALLIAAVWWRLQPKPPVPLPIEIQTRNELELLRLPAEDGKTISRISQVLKHYFVVAFELPAGEMTTTEFNRAIAASEKAGDELAASVSEFLRLAGVQSSACSRSLELVEQGEARRAELRQVAQPK